MTELERLKLLSSMLRYDGGKLYWLEWRNGVRKDLIAGSRTKNGYISVGANGVKAYAHRIVWFIHHGEIPKGYDIDHVNHDRTDNRIENLRLVRRSENAMNLSRAKNNKTGFTDVFFNKARSKYFVSVKVDRKHVFGGWHLSIESAVASRNKLWDKFGFHKNHGA